MRVHMYICIFMFMHLAEAFIQSDLHWKEDRVSVAYINPTFEHKS